MNFKELLEKYKNGTLSEEEKVYVENEIEKNEAINEFLADELELNLEISNTSIDDNEIDHKKIKQAINKKLRKVVALSVISVLIILFAGKYIVSPIVDSVYYNPTKKSLAKYHDNMYFDMRAYTELYLPGVGFSNVYTTPEGYGKYDIFINQRNLFKGTNVNTNISLIRNNRFGHFENLSNWDILFSPNETEESKKIRRIFSERDLEYLKELPDTSYVAAYVDFKEDLSMEELYYLEDEFKDSSSSDKLLDFKWVAIRVASKGKNMGNQVGFNPNMNDSSSISEYADQERYPNLAIADYFKNSKTSDIPWEKQMSKVYETHFTSLLQYLYDRKDFTVSLDKTKMQGEFYKASLEYVEKNGVKTYGVLVYGEAKDIIDFMEKDITDCVYISDIKVSKFSK